MSISTTTSTTSPLSFINDDDRVLTFAEVEALARISASTRRRIFQAGHGPKITHLSDRRRGVLVKHFREWMAARAGA